MRNDGWLQKLLYLLMIILGVYILYKGGGILLSSPAVRRTLGSGTVQQSLEDAAMRTYVPGYTATVEGRKNQSWISIFMNQAVPVYSYVAGGEAERNVGAEETSPESNVGRDTETEETPSGSEAEQDVQNEKSVSGDRNTAAINSENNSMSMDEQSISGSEENNSNGTEVIAGAENDTEENIREQPEKNVSDETVSEEPIKTDTDVILPEEPIKTDTDTRLPEETAEIETEEAKEAAAISAPDSILLEQLQDFNYLLNNYYTVDGGTTADAELLDADALLNTDLSLELNSEVPQILIYHTHSQEAFADSREGVVEDTIVGMGEVLAEHLRAYGYQVIHDTGVYDLVDGVLDRSVAYDYARASIQQILEENPTIEVIVDLHRDGVEGQKFVTEIGGKPCSMIMFFNGISRNNQDEPLYWLENPYIQENLAFSLQLQVKAREQYPGFTRNIYLKAERFNLHLRPRSLLIEAGTQLNTVEEERNAMKPLAELVRQVLAGE